VSSLAHANLLTDGSFENTGSTFGNGGDSAMSLSNSFTASSTSTLIQIQGLLGDQNIGLDKAGIVYARKRVLVLTARN
jgi:hypothetical protein